MTIPRFRACAVPDCNNNSAVKGCAHGYCPKHYRRWKLYGDPLALAPRKPGKIENWINEVALPFDGSGCLIWPFYRNRQGYACYTTNGRPYLASRVICRLAHGEPKAEALVAAHSCFKGHDGCVNPRHLRWATASENERDKVSSGTSNRGENHPLAKLTEDDVYIIRSLAGVITQAEIGEMLSVSKWTVGDVIRRERWGWLK